MNSNSHFSDIAYYPDSEVQGVLHRNRENTMFQALINYVFPDKSEQEVKEILSSCQSIQSWQTNVLRPLLQRMLKETANGFTVEGLENLDKTQTYLYISNHRDIVLDTSLTNMALLDADGIMSASAIGNNLVQLPFLMDFAKISRNFLVKRGLSPREMLMSSKKLSSYIHFLINENNRSVWIAQREGRAKDGNDETNPGLLKMIAMAAGKSDPVSYLGALNIVPIAMSYEYDPTDYLKVKELYLKQEGKTYEKAENEDLQHILKGVLGQKGKIYLSFGKPMTTDIAEIVNTTIPNNKKIQLLAQRISQRIQGQYHLQPSNYMAYDALYTTSEYRDKYTAADKAIFDERLAVYDFNEAETEIFYKIYANPVLNKARYVETIA